MINAIYLVLLVVLLAGAGSYVLLAARMRTVAGRELAAMFYSPIAYVVLFLFVFIMSVLFVIFSFRLGAVTEVRTLFSAAQFVLFFFIPPLTMSLLADEYRSGRIEMLRTSPMTETDLLVGKYLGALGFYAVLLATTLVYLLLLMIFGGPDYGTTLSGYLGMLLLGMMFVAIGLFFSSVTQNQIVAFLATMLVLGFLTYIGPIAQSYLPGTWELLGMKIPVRGPLMYLSVGPHVDDFLKGVVESAHAIYFLSGTFLFLFLTYLVLESRKWR